MNEIGLDGAYECGTVYEWNKQEMSLQPPLPRDVLTKELANIGAWFSSDLTVKYYMLLNRELADYTVFNFLSHNYYKGVEELIEVLDRCGWAQAIEYNHEHDYFEIWVKNKCTLKTHLYLLFPCDDFIIEV